MLERRLIVWAFVLLAVIVGAVVLFPGQDETAPTPSEDENLKEATRGDPAPRPSSRIPGFTNTSDRLSAIFQPAEEDAPPDLPAEREPYMPFLPARRQAKKLRGTSWEQGTVGATPAFRDKTSGLVWSDIRNSPQRWTDKLTREVREQDVLRHIVDHERAADLPTARRVCTTLQPLEHWRLPAREDVERAFASDMHTTIPEGAHGFWTSSPCTDPMDTLRYDECVIVAQPGLASLRRSRTRSLLFRGSDPRMPSHIRCVMDPPEAP